MLAHVPMVDFFRPPLLMLPLLLRLFSGPAMPDAVEFKMRQSSPQAFQVRLAFRPRRNAGHKSPQRRQ